MINTLVGRNGRTRLTPMADLAQRAITENATLDQTAFDQTLIRFNQAKISGMNKYDAATLWLAPGAIKAGSILPFLPKAGLTVPFTRNSAAWRRNSAGVIVQEAVDVPLIYYPQGGGQPALRFEPVSINHIRNPIMNGAAVGIPGTLPVHWATTVPAGMTRQVVSSVVENGINIIELRFFGTPASGAIYVYFETTTGAAATVGQQYTISAWLSRTGTFPQGTTIVGLEERNASAVYLTEGGTTLSPGIGTAFERRNGQRIIQNANTAFGRPFVSFANLNTSAAYDFTIRIGYPQMEQYAYNTSFMRSNGTAAFTRAVSQLPLNGLQAASVFAANEGCVLFDVSRLVANAAGTAPLVLRRADNTEVLRLEANGIANTHRINLPTLGQSSAYNAGQRIAVAWNGSNVRISQGGVLLDTFTGTLGAIDQLRYTGNGLVDVRELLGYSAAPTNAALNALTV